MAAPLPRRFIRKHNDNGTHDSTCPVCNRMLGSVRIELTLDELEGSHLCLEADLVRRTSEPNSSEQSGTDFQARASEALAGAPVLWKKHRQNPST